MHRNSQKRYYGAWAYFLTCNTKDKHAYFEHDVLCKLWIEELKICKQIKKFKLSAFCLNYDHFHLLLQPDEEVANISQIMQSLKKNFSQDANKIILDTPEGANSNSRLHRVGMDLYGEMYRSSLIELPKFQRQKSYHDHIIRDAYDYSHHRYYTKDNYLKHDLSNDWTYHSGNIEYEYLIDQLDI